MSIARARLRTTADSSLELKFLAEGVRIDEGYPRREGVVVALFAFALALICGYELVFRYHVVMGDAMSRALSGLYAVFRPQFHLASVGFLWNPLPSLMAIPLQELRFLWPPMAEWGFAGNVISATFGAIGAFHLNRLLWRFGLTRSVRLLWTALFVLNPMILLYAANGMTDGMMGATAVATVEAIAAYLAERRPSSLVRAATWITVGFMIRYESVPIGAGITVGLALAIYRSSRSVRKAESAVVTFLFPVFCAGLTWILLNWMIMKNPFYFADSIYSNASQIASGAYNISQVVAARHSLSTSLYEVFHFSLLFWLYVPCAFGVALLQLRRNPNPLGLPLLLGSLGAPVLQVALLYTHRSADWSRFFIYYIPFGVMLFGFLLSQVPLALRKSVTLVACGLLFSANWVTWQTIHSPIWGYGDSAIIDHIEYGVPVSNDTQNAVPYITGAQTVASYINGHPSLTVLMSSMSSFAVIPFIKNPNQIVFTNDADFQAVLLNPLGRVDAILAPSPDQLAMASDELTRQYPGLWAGAVSWTRLIRTFPDGNRLFSVLPDAP